MTSKADLTKALAPLVAEGTISVEQANAVATQLVSTHTPVQAKSLKGLISEAFVYLGGAIIVGSAALLISQTWNDLGKWGRPGVLVLAAVVLWIAGVVIQRRKANEEGRRLTSTLLTGSAVLVAVAANAFLRDLWIPLDAQGFQDWAKIPLWVDPAQVAISMSLAALIGIFAYRQASSALALMVVGGSSLGVAMSVGQLINYWLGPETPRDQQFFAPYPWLAPALTGIGSLVWLWLWKRGVFKEEIIAHILGLVGLFIAINSLREYYDEDFVAAFLVVVGLVGLWFYVQTHMWPYLASGMGSILMGGIQMLFRYVEGVGGALASMALGACLVVVGIRLVKEKANIADS